MEADREQAAKWQADAASWIVTLLDEGLNRNATPLPRKDAEILLACLRLMTTRWEPKDLKARFERVLEAIDDADSDLKVHLVLLRAQWYFDGYGQQRELWPQVSPIVKGELAIARNCLAAEVPVPLREKWEKKRRIWEARIVGQEALLKWREAENSDETSRKGLWQDAKTTTLDAIAKLQATGDKIAEQDAIFLRFLIGKHTYDHWDELEGPTQQRWCTDALEQLEKFTEVDWIERNRFLESDHLPAVDWDWGAQEIGELVDDSGKATTDRLKNLKRELLGKRK